MKSHLLALAPRLEKDDAGQIFGKRPICCPPEAVVVDLFGMTVEQVAESTGIVRGGSTPQLTVGWLL